MAAPGGPVDGSFLAGLIDAFHAAHLRTFGYNYAGQQKVELVNFCVSGFGLIERPQMPRLAARGGDDAGAQVGAAGLFRRRVPRHADLRPRRAAAGLPARRAGGGRGVRLDHGGVPGPASRRRSARHPDHPSRSESKRQAALAMRHRAPTSPATAKPPRRRRGCAQVDPIVLQIVEGTLNSIEAEIEYAIERTARSPDDPRGARLSRRPVRPLLPQAHRALLFGDAERGGARLPARDHAAGRRLSDERHLPDRGQHRAPARSLQHRAGVPRRRGRRLHPGVRPSRRYRRARAGLDAGNRDDRVRGRPRGAADQALRRRRAQRGGLHHHQAQHPRAGHARRRSRQRGAGLRDGRAPHGRAVRALRPRHGRGLLPGHPRQVPRHLPPASCCRRSPTASIPGRIMSSTTG